MLRHRVSRNSLSLWCSFILCLKGAFKPFVDENANRKENSTPAVKVLKINTAFLHSMLNQPVVQTLRGRTPKTIVCYS